MSNSLKTDQYNRLTKTKLLDYIRSIDTASYSEFRNYLGGSTRLSEYITRGFISLPEIRTALLENNTASASYKLINELAWREYWQLVWQVRGDDIFEYIRPPVHILRPGIPQAFIDATTGIQAIDDGIRQLQNTGYIHNHMRMWIAGLICNVAKCDWKTGADWMYSYLIDGDYASNHLSWQWVAGSYTGKPYLPQQDNINTYTDTVQHGSYLDVTYDQIANMAVPDKLAVTTLSLPVHNCVLPTSTISISSCLSQPEILLYSPWTLDPEWRSESKAVRVLLLDSDVFGNGKFSQQVIQSIVWFSQQIPGLQLLCCRPSDLSGISNRITRQSYQGIASWPGRIDTNKRLFPDVPVRFYPSFSSFWKQAQK